MNFSHSSVTHQLSKPLDLVVLLAIAPIILLVCLGWILIHWRSIYIVHLLTALALAGLMIFELRPRLRAPNRLVIATSIALSLACVGLFSAFLAIYYTRNYDMPWADLFMMGIFIGLVLSGFSFAEWNRLGTAKIGLAAKIVSVGLSLISIVVASGVIFILLTASFG